VLRANKFTHSAPLFRKLSRLNFYDLHNLQLSSFVYVNTYQSDNDAFQSYFVPNTAVHTHDTRSATKLHCIYSRTQLRASSVWIRGPVYWNLIPSDIQSLPSLVLFKKYMKLHLLYLYSKDTVNNYVSSILILQNFDFVGFHGVNIQYGLTHFYSVYLVLFLFIFSSFY